MLRLSKLADYAVVVLVRLSQGEPCQTSPGIAAITGLPEPTVAKVLKGLAASGLVTSQRGARGGYRLARKLEQIPLADVVAAIDGPVHLTACVEGSQSNCEVQHACACRGQWDPVNDVVMRALGTISLADIAAPRPIAATAAPQSVAAPAAPRSVATASLPTE